MEAATNITNELSESTLTIPAPDTRDEAVKDLDALCRKCVNLAHEVANAERAMFEAERAQDFSSYGRAAMTFGELRERLYNLKEQIEARTRIYNQTHGLGIFVAHTAAGLPIRVDKVRKTPLWA